MRERIKEVLSGLEPRRLTEGFVREAAVLMPIFAEDGAWRVLLTKRTEEVETHKGQISFPGGMREPGEPLERTALRETFEEVGIAADRIEILGRFHDYISITDVRVTPFAALLRTPFAVTPQVHEVAEILRVPLATFSTPASLRVEREIFRGEAVDVYYYDCGGHTVWGLTARILHDFLETVAGREAQGLGPEGR